MDIWNNRSDIFYKISILFVLTPSININQFNHLQTMAYFEYTIELLEAEIDSLKDAYKSDTQGLKTQYSVRILEYLKVKKMLNQSSESNNK